MFLLFVRWLVQSLHPLTTVLITASTNSDFQDVTYIQSVATLGGRRHFLGFLFIVIFSLSMKLEIPMELHLDPEVSGLVLCKRHSALQ